MFKELHRLNAATVYLVQVYRPISLTVINHFTLLYIQCSFIRLARDINDLNPYKETNNLSTISIIFRVRAILFIF